MVKLKPRTINPDIINKMEAAVVATSEGGAALTVAGITNPWIIVGCLVFFGALVVYSVVKGNKKKVNMNC